MRTHSRINAGAIAVAAPQPLHTDLIRITRRMTLLALAAAAGFAAVVSFSPRAGAESAGAGFVYTADEHGGSVSQIALDGGKVDIIPVPVMPHNVQFVSDTGILLMVGMPMSGMEEGHGGDGHGEGEEEPKGRLIVIDTAGFASGQAASIDVGAHPAHVIADAQGKRAFVSNSEDNTISVIDLDTGTAIGAASTGDYPHGLRMSPDGKSIYVANVKDGTVSVIDTATLAETATIKVGSAPVQVGFVPDGSRVYVSLRDDNKVAVIDTATKEVTGRVEVGRSPIQVHATPDGRFVYVANQGTDAEPDDTVSVIDVASETVVETIRTGAGAHGVVVSADGAFVFVTNIMAGTVSQISVESQSVVKTYPVGKGPNGITFQAPKPTPANAG
ncbi:cytochrome D1 domain-containing protein [Mesorhizobium sp.]|uniref:YVTN family beta-propeller repeat protein n=1 Tax=Mesorhizobium sp. TaxID=1871066 RepID=UPI000FE6CF5D|nr:cytochrome D1 domain-containing protein [Mesorhizobium sp.]RWD36467.1 MAG: YncE family protein [Mesorhizobium sp.]RWD47638.1 MAG: YncE family protein [Mesorhizobium sp.]RWD79401.1 MAG: YncE family protein [Mesorhizobium sp.]TIS42443.1 MAG: YncE family protein [Mesorhizobium sp.]